MRKGDVERIFERARNEALASLTAQIKSTLPKGWTVYFMVGWGFSVDDENRACIVGSMGTDHARLNRRQTHTLDMCATFADVFGYGNERITA